MALRDQPYLPLYVQDFLTDEKLIECSAQTTGVYIRLMCIMHKSDEYGTILLKQKDKQSDEQIKNFALKLIKQMPFSEQIIFEALNELLNEKVLIIEGDYLIQKRMVKDNDLSLKRSIAGKEGGEKTQFALAKVKANRQAKVKANSENENNSIDNSNIIYTIYYDTELNLLNGDPKKEEYEKFIKFLFGDNELKTKLECWLKLEKQLSFEQYCKLREKAQKKNKKMAPMFLSGYNNPKYLKGKKTVYQTINTWLDRD